MTSYVALLRGVNIGGHRLVAMTDLRELLTRLGLVDVRSLLQSGNLLFRSDRPANGELARLLETELHEQLGLATTVFVRSASEWQELMDRNPFPREAERDPAHVAVMFLVRDPGPEAVVALQSAVNGPEIIRASGRHLFTVYPSGFARSRLTTSLIERTLATRCTGRNWDTVTKLAALLANT